MAKTFEQTRYQALYAEALAAAQRSAATRTDADRKVAQMKRGAMQAWRDSVSALSADELCVMNAERLDPAEVKRRRGLIAASLCGLVGKVIPGRSPLTTTMAMKATADARVAAFRASPAGKVAQLEERVRDAATEAAAWRHRAGERGLPPSQKALDLRAAAEAERTFTKLRAQLRVAAPKSRIGFMTLAELAPKAGPLPSDVADVVEPMAALGEVLTDIAAALRADGKIPATMVRAVGAALETYLEAAPMQGDAVDALNEAIGADVSNTEAAIEAIADFCQATGVPFQAPNSGPTPGDRLAASVRAGRPVAYGALRPAYATRR